MSAWLDDARRLLEAGEDCWLVTIMDVRGSAPREVGAKMLVTKTEVIGTIGGGQLEHQCTKLACERLDGEDHGSFVRRYTLGANCGQCCGGVVEVLFEPLSAAASAWLSDLGAWYDQRVPVVLVTLEQPRESLARFLVTAEECRGYGVPAEALSGDVVARAREMLGRDGRDAGHRPRRVDPTAPGKPGPAPGSGSKTPETPGPAPVAAGGVRMRPKQEKGSAVLLDPLVPSGFHLAIFGAGHTGTAVVRTMAGIDCNLRWIDSRRGMLPRSLPGDVTCIEALHPEREVAAMPSGAYYLVMTHSHALDYEIVSSVLARGDFAYCGLIGSVSKRRRFERRLRKEGLPDSMLERLVCPIGIAGIDSKQPEAIAIAVAAELLQIRSAQVSQGAEDRRKVRNLRILRR